jgi:hypothetical protein
MAQTVSPTFPAPRIPTHWRASTAWPAESGLAGRASR